MVARPGHRRELHGRRNAGANVSLGSTLPEQGSVFAVEGIRGSAHRTMTFDPESPSANRDRTALALGAESPAKREPAPYVASQALFERAKGLIPGGIHLSGRPLVDPERSPLYFERGQGARIWDADGREYVDFVMAYGPFLLGYAHPEVDRAAVEQLTRGNLLSLNHPLHLTFMEALVARFPGAEMGVFLKTG